VLNEEAGGKQTPGFEITEQRQQVGNAANTGLMTPTIKGLNQYRTGKIGPLAGWNRSHCWSSAQPSSLNTITYELTGARRASDLNDGCGRHLTTENKMCVIVMVGDIECSTKAELRNAIGIEPERRKKDYKTFEDGDCLCPCDLEKTAKRANMTLSGYSWDMQILTANV